MFDMAEYNGVKLLAFPEELDVTAFPYLIWAKGSNNINILYAFSEKVYMTEDSFLQSGAAGTLQQYAIVNGAYDKLADWEYNGGQNISSDEFKGIIWSNWNIQTPIGNIYFYGSKPVPVTKWVTQRVTIDLAQKTNEPKIYATQMDNNSRTWVISLLENGEKFILPDDCEITLRCFRPDGKTFLNSTLVNGGDAWRIVDNVISFIPPSETFECAGVAEVAFTITVVNDSETYRLNTFVFQVEIDEDPLLKGLGIDEEPEEPEPPDEPVIPDVPVVPDAPSDCITFASSEPFTLAAVDSEKHWDGTIYYTTYHGEWSVWDGKTTLVSAINNSDEHRLYLRGIGNSKVSKGIFYRTFDLTGENVHCRGNIENLLDFETVANGQHPIMSDNCFTGLFKGCTSLVRPPELPATTLANSCYREMFYGCTSLVRPPELPAITLTDHCYRNMFEGCTSLVSAPELPATTLAINCYHDMFCDCTSLVAPPKLPATNLPIACYQRMFEGCTSLVALPKLPATNLPSGCYQRMFYGCTSIKLSATQSDVYHTAYRLPSSGGGTVDNSHALDRMFEETGGTFTGDPQINSTYYTSNTVI